MAGSQQDGNAAGASAEAFSEGPSQAKAPGNQTGIDPLCDQDGDEVSDYIDNSAYTDTVG